jgi:hypothetical protein
MRVLISGYYAILTTCRILCSLPPRSPYPARHHLEGEVTRILLRSCLARNSNARSFAEIACLYLMRHLATGAIEDYSITKAAELGSRPR